jgi:hypothetical protein
MLRDLGDRNGLLLHRRRDGDGDILDAADLVADAGDGIDRRICDGKALPAKSHKFAATLCKIAEQTINA